MKHGANRGRLPTSQIKFKGLMTYSSEWGACPQMIGVLETQGRFSDSSNQVWRSERGQDRSLGVKGKKHIDVVCTQNESMDLTRMGLIFLTKSIKRL